MGSSRDSKNTPTPNHADFTASSNSISLALAKRTSHFKQKQIRNPDSQSYTLSSNVAKSIQSPSLAIYVKADDELNDHAQLNEGLGYVVPRKTLSSGDSKREKEMLRRKLVRKPNGSGRPIKPGSESEDEDEGRSGLGKRKKRSVPRGEEHGIKHLRLEEDEAQESVADDEQAPRAIDGREKRTGTHPHSQLTPLSPMTIEDISRGDSTKHRSQTKKKRKKTTSTTDNLFSK